MKKKDLKCCGNCKYLDSRIVRINKNTERFTDDKCSHVDSYHDVIEPWSVCTLWEFDSKDFVMRGGG